MPFIYKILSFEEFDAIKHRVGKAVNSTMWKGNSLDQHDGFIHFSTKNQAVFVANQFFATTHSQLKVLEFDSEAVGSCLKWEAPVHPAKTADSIQRKSMDNERFPHLYGDGLELAKCVRVIDWKRNENGIYNDFQDSLESE